MTADTEQRKPSDPLGQTVTCALLPTLTNSYIPKDNSLQSETVHYKRGVCQQFCLPSHTVDPSEWAEEEVSSRRPPGESAGQVPRTDLQGAGAPRDPDRQHRTGPGAQRRAPLQPSNDFVPWEGHI